MEGRPAGPWASSSWTRACAAFFRSARRPTGSESGGLRQRAIGRLVAQAVARCGNAGLDGEAASGPASRVGRTVVFDAGHCASSSSARHRPAANAPSCAKRSPAPAPRSSRSSLSPSPQASSTSTGPGSASSGRGAAAAGKTEHLVALLTDDATAISDGAGLTEKLLRCDTPQRIAAIARAGFRSTPAKQRLGGVSAVHYALAILFVPDGRVVGAVTFDISDGKLATVRGIATPARVVRLTKAWRQHEPTRRSSPSGRCPVGLGGSVAHRHPLVVRGEGMVQVVGWPGETSRSDGPCGGQGPGPFTALGLPQVFGAREGPAVRSGRCAEPRPGEQ
uniref:Putative RNA polymerase ECF-subfamily sigma factor n=1 Tax=Streptomyces lavendulae TaxID=1914 RepID=B0CN42_STRLA|nr:putative RNA polymerase ECF-subfamily sigma factor [Streptomyces lavendulae]